MPTGTRSNTPSAWDLAAGPMTPRERFRRALDRLPPIGRVPHFELVYFLTMESFGKVHPSHRNYAQWFQMTDAERQRHREDMADVYLATAERFGHDAILLHPNPESLEETLRLVETVRARSGDRYFLLLPGDATFKIPGGNGMQDFSYRIVDDPDGLLAEATQKVDRAIVRAAVLAKQGLLDGFVLTSDYCLNTGPFLSPAMFGTFVAPFLARLVSEYRAMGFYTIKHTDGNILPIVDQLVAANPHALHSLDPQAGVDIADIKRRFGDRLCLVGNVDCGLMQTGTDDEVDASARYALRSGMPGGGYIFSTSNCIYTGMPLARYERILRVLHEEGVYR
jgi:uroporphyrinogen decarboxylase